MPLLPLHLCCLPLMLQHTGACYESQPIALHAVYGIDCLLHPDCELDIKLRGSTCCTVDTVRRQRTV